MYPINLQNSCFSHLSLLNSFFWNIPHFGVLKIIFYMCNRSNLYIIFTSLTIVQKIFLLILNTTKFILSLIFDLCNQVCVFLFSNIS